MKDSSHNQLVVLVLMNVLPTETSRWKMGYVVMRNDREVYSVSSIGVLPFIEGSLRDCTSGLVAVSHDSEEHA